MSTTEKQEPAGGKGKDSPVPTRETDSTQSSVTHAVLDLSSKDSVKQLLAQAGSGFTRGGAHSETLDIPAINALTDGGARDSRSRHSPPVSNDTVYRGDGGMSEGADYDRSAAKKLKYDTTNSTSTDRHGNTTQTWEASKDGTQITLGKDGSRTIKLLTGDEFHQGTKASDSYIVTAAGLVLKRTGEAAAGLGGLISQGVEFIAKGAEGIGKAAEDAKKDQAAAGYAAVDAKKVEDAVDAIRKASVGWGTDEKTIYQSLEGKSEAEIRAMKARYQEKYGVKLEDELKSELKVPILGDIFGEWKKAEALLNKRDTVDLKDERTKLDATAKERMSPTEYQQFQQRMQELEARKGKDGVSDEEIARTYREVNRLLEARGDTPLKPDERKNLAMQVMENAADPSKISQGSNNTCNVTAVETATYRRSPSEAARMVTDIALTGKYVTRNGDVINQDPSPRTDASRNYPPRTDGARVHASEIFEIAAVNAYYQEKGIQRRYDQVNVPPPQNKTDNGERLYDTSKNPPEEVKNDNGKPVRAPGLVTGDLVDIAKTITGTDNIGALQSRSYSGGDSRVTSVGSEQELADRLAEAKKNGKLPMIILVNTEVEPLWKDSGGGAAGGSGGPHVITVTDYVPGPPPKVNVDNQWGNSADYQGDKKMSVHDLYKTMLSNQDATAEVQKEVDQARKEGRVDVFKETDLLRMQKKTGQISDADYEKAVNDLVRRTKEDYDKRGAAVTPQEKLDSGRRLAELASGLTPDKSLPLLDAMKNGGIIDQGEHTYQVELVGWRLAREKEKLTADGKMNGGDEQKAYEAKAKAYQDYLAKLDEAKRNEILNQLKAWG